MLKLRTFRPPRAVTCHVHLKLSDVVPRHDPTDPKDVTLLQTFIHNHAKILVVTGAGISTESGIPDYRSEGVGLYARSNHRPVQYQEFLKSPKVRQRYWARNFIGWPKFSSRQPNTTHFILQALEESGKVRGVVTQNVDGLHCKAGSRNVVELHGTAFKVVCLDCDQVFDRHQVQEEIMAMNPGLRERTDVIRPDGDVEVDSDKIRTFKPPFCGNCGGILKPDIIFFGDNVPRSRVEAVRQLVGECDAVLVLGSSLTVFSGYRIILQACDLRKYIAIVNIGETRGDKHAHLKISARCGDILAKLTVNWGEVKMGTIE